MNEQNTTETKEVRFPTNEEIINALDTIKAVCKSFYKCSDECPLCRNKTGECAVMYDSPNNWKVNLHEM